MRTTLLVIAALALSAGCIGTDGAPSDPADATDADPDTQPEAAASGSQLPKDMNEEVFITGGFDAVGQQASERCSVQPWCFSYRFDVQVPATMAAELTWSLPASDFDLLLMEDGEEHTAATTHAPGTSERIEMVLAPGNYSLVIVPYAVVDDVAQLEAGFSPASEG